MSRHSKAPVRPDPAGEKQSGRCRRPGSCLSSPSPPHETVVPCLHLSKFTELFIQVVCLAREMSLIKLGTISGDGIKIKANAGRYRAMRCSCIQTIETKLLQPQTEVDATAYINVAAEVVNTSADVQQLPMVMAAVRQTPLQLRAKYWPVRTTVVTLQ